MNIEIFIIYLLCSYKCGKAALQEATQYLVFFGGGDCLCFEWLFFAVDGLSFSLLHLDLTYTTLHHLKYIHRMSISGIYNC